MNITQRTRILYLHSAANLTITSTLVLNSFSSVYVSVHPVYLIIFNQIFQSACLVFFTREMIIKMVLSEYFLRSVYGNISDQ